MGRSERGGSTAIIGSRAIAAEQVALPAGVVAECDIAEGIPAIPSPRVGVRALVLVRMFSEPLGMLAERLPVNRMNSRDLAGAIVRKFEPQLQERFSGCGLAWDGQLPLTVCIRHASQHF